MAKRKNPAAVALGRKGGKKGGKARAANLTPEQLSAIGRMGAAKRWAKLGSGRRPTASSEITEAPATQ